MEFNSDFAIIQGILKNQEKVHGKLINLKCGDEVKIIEICTKLGEPIKERNIDKEDGLREIYLLLLLNTGNDRFDYLENEPNCGHIIGSIPKLSDLVFLSIVETLTLDEFVFESIIHLPPIMSIELVEMYLAQMRSSKDPFKLLKHINLMARAVFIKLVVLENDVSDVVNMTKVKLKYYECYLAVIEHFTSSRVANYETWKENKLYFFSSRIMLALAGIIKDCCKYYLEPVVERKECQSIYNITTNKEFTKNNKLPKDDKLCDGTILLKQCLQIILSKLSSSAQSISVMVWLSWTDMEEFTDENVQTIVGNEIYHCLNYIKENKIKECLNSHLHTELIGVLSNLSIKPTSEDDEIQSADLTTILNALDNPTKTHSKWLSALITNDNFVPDSETLKIIGSKIDSLCNNKLVEQLLHKYMNFRTKDKVVDAELQNLFTSVVLSSLKNFHFDNQVLILESFITSYGPVDTLKGQQFDTLLTETFNKIIDLKGEDMNVYTEFIGLSLQSSITVLRKLIKVLLSSSNHGKIVFKLLKLIKCVCNYKLDAKSDKNVLFCEISETVSYMEELSEVECSNFVTLVSKLISDGFVDGNLYLTECVMPNLHDGLNYKKWLLVNNLLNILKDVLDVLVTDSGTNECNDINMELPVYVIFLCQLIDQTRCTLTNFNLQLVNVCDTAVNVLINVLESFDVDCQQIDTMNWMKQELRKLNVITQMHVFAYIKLPSFDDHVSKKSIEVYWLRLVLCGCNSDNSFLFDLRRDSFVRTLTKILVFFTIGEWKLMFANLVPSEDIEALCALFFACVDAVLLIEAAITPHVSTDSDDNITLSHSDSILAAVFYCTKNLIQIVQDIFFPHIKEISSMQLAEIFIKVCYVLKGYPEVVKNSSSWVLIKVLQNLINIIIQNDNLSTESKPNLQQMSRVCAGISLIPDPEVRAHLFKTVSTMIADY